jgi:DNA topoisomerase-1
MTITLDTAVSLIEAKREADKKRHLKSFDEVPGLEVLNGRYGPYISYESKNYRIPKDLHDKAAELTSAQCMDIIKNAPEPRTKTRKVKK